MRFLAGQVGRIVGLVLLAAAGLGGAQGPSFAQQYLQRLGGHLDEARIHLRRVDASREYAALDSAARVEIRAVLAARVSALESAHEAISGTSAVLRPLVVAWHLDGDIASAAWRDFEPGLPISAGGVLYGGGTALLAFLLFVAGRGAARRRPLRAGQTAR